MLKSEKIFQETELEVCEPEVIRFTGRNLSQMAAAVGFFDGVHRGHRFLFEQVRTEAARRGLGSMVVTFSERPRSVLSADRRPHLLTDNTEKLRLLCDCDLDACAWLHFTPALAKLSAENFMRHCLYERLGVRCLVVGYDHRFGCGRSAGFADYQAYGRSMGMDVIRAEALQNPDFIVSSSIVRHLLSAGRVEEAAACLGYPYELSGTVVGGHRVGRQIGFPTANLRPAEPLKLLPADGVYAVRAVVQGRSYAGMANIGRRPTLDNGEDRSVEAHLFDFDEDIYGSPMTLVFEHRLRGERRFESLSSLQLQLQRDAMQAKKLLGL